MGAINKNSYSDDDPIIYPTVHDVLRDLQEGKLKNDILKYDIEMSTNDKLYQAGVQLHEATNQSEPVHSMDIENFNTEISSTPEGDQTTIENENVYYRDYPIYREGWSRIIQPPTKATRHVHKVVCSPSGTIERVTVTKGTSKRIPGAYWNSRKSHWGGLWPT